MKALALFIACMFLVGLNNSVCQSVFRSSGAEKLVTEESAVSQNIKLFFNETQTRTQLNYPNLTEDLYRKSYFNYIWFNAFSDNQLWRAMQLLDCVLPYGLIPDDYHFTELTYNRIRTITSDSTDATLKLKIKTDILLTDAIVSLIIHLHYGKENPYISKQQIDNVNNPSFKVDSVLQKAFLQDFEKSIVGVQPVNNEYKLLQDYLRLATAQYIDDCYTVSNDTLKVVALNLERYRWQNSVDSTYISVNIPSFTLKFADRDNIHDFKVIVGGPSTPTPTILTNLKSLHTSPDRSLPGKILSKTFFQLEYLAMSNISNYNNRESYASPFAFNPNGLLEKASGNLQGMHCKDAMGRVLFYFDNPYHVYLHDTPKRSLFSKNYRALSHGCILVENPKELASLILTAIHTPESEYSKVMTGIDRNKKYQYSLPVNIPIIVRYITCEMKNGELIMYKDLYGKDKPLINKLFNSINFVKATN